MNEKFIGHSKTFLGLLLTGFVAFLPDLGVNFTENAAVLISTTWDLILLAATNLFTIYGMVTSTTSKTLKPIANNPANNPLNLKTFITEVAK